MFNFFFPDSYDATTYMSEDDRYFEKRCAEIKAQQEKLEKQAECLENLRDTLEDFYTITSIEKDIIDKILFEFCKLASEAEKIPTRNDIRRIISEYIEIN